MEVTVGIDIGFKNFGICIVNYKTNTDWKIIKWDILNLGIKKNSSLVNISIAVKNILLVYCNNLIITNVIIEQQPKKRIIMERILMCCIDYFTYCHMKSKIQLMKSQDKFDVCPGTICPKGSKNYSNRKDLSIVVGKLCIDDKLNTNINTHPHYKKLDDLYDALLMILSFHKYRYIN